MNCTEELRKARRDYRRTAMHQDRGVQAPPKRTRVILAKAASRDRRPITHDEVIQAMILRRRKSRGPNWAQEFYSYFVAGKAVQLR